MEKLFSSLPGKMEYQKNLADIVAYRIGGEARYFYTPKDSADLLKILEISQGNSIPLYILGSGTNLLVCDTGYDGIILWLGPTAHTVDLDVQVLSKNNSEVLIRVPSHFSKARLLDIAIMQQWGGLEFSAGIPGSLGGAVYMNAGTKWGSYGEVITEVEFVSLKKGIFSLKSDEIGFKYRGHGEGLLDGSTVVSAVNLKLKNQTSQKEIFSKVDEILSYRGQRQPLELPNCGSVFKNPPNSEKGAGRLIEASNLKGMRVGDAEVSLKHANFILNCGKAKATDVKELIQKIKDTVHSKFQLELEPEVIFL